MGGEMGGGPLHWCASQPPGGYNPCSQPGTRHGRGGWKAAPPTTNEAQGKEMKP